MRTCFVRGRALVTLWVFLNVMDMMLTMAVVGSGAIELLPVARTLLDWEPVSFVLFKIMLPLTVLPVLYWYGRFQLLRLLNLLLGIIVLWNTLLFVAMF